MGNKSNVTVDPDLAHRHLCVWPGFKLSDISPDDTPGFNGESSDFKDAGRELFAARDEELADLQERMYARARAELPDSPSLLVILQGMDAAGKGGIIRRVFGSIDPQGLQITSFKAPTEEEASHDFLWRIKKRVPEPGIIGIFDRSHYEDVLVQRVRSFAPPEEIERRYDAIVEFERSLVRSGTRILKFMLHVGPDEQAKRLRERIDRPDKHWKYNRGDIDDRELWDEFAEAYEIAMLRTNTHEAPWFVIPANRKWYSRLTVKSLLLRTLREMNLEWPAATFDQEEERARLEASTERLNARNIAG